MRNTAYALEHPVHFLGEKRTERYKWYSEGVSQLKNGNHPIKQVLWGPRVLGAKNSSQRQAVPGLGRCGA